jgi:hypothetical protein
MALPIPIHCHQPNPGMASSYPHWDTPPVCAGGGSLPRCRLKDASYSSGRCQPPHACTYRACVMSVAASASAIRKIGVGTRPAASPVRRHAATPAAL